MLAPCLFSMSVKSLISDRFSVDISFRPQINKYFALGRSSSFIVNAPILGCLWSNRGVSLYRVNPMASNANAIGIHPEPMYRE